MREDKNHRGNVPQWVQNAVFYQIFPDRFRKSDDYQYSGKYVPWDSLPTTNNMFGGNLVGITEKLDYIKDLGCNALYLCPIFQSNSNHRYHTFDYFKIDPILGTEEDFKNLINACHQRDMKIILDGVFNHCGRGFYQFNNILELGIESPFIDWFHIKDFPLNAFNDQNPNYECWWGLRELPKFNTSNPDVREFLFSVGEHWIEMGIDGWRLDVPNEIDDDDFWREFRNRIKKINPEAYIVGEIWDDPSRWLQGDQFDGVMNYPMRRLIIDSLFEYETLISDAGDFCQRILEIFPKDRFGIPMNLLGSHDNMRISTVANGDEDLLSIAWAILMMSPGCIFIYSGDEIGLEGGKDPDNRRSFPWHNLENTLRNSRIHTEIKQWIKWRRQYSAMRTGTYGAQKQDETVILWREDEYHRVELHLGLPGKSEKVENRAWVVDFIAK
ncbi:MAG: glycoside hydrolase family 13 protein [Fibrobacter sp.]|nr:glycoside hydrolase family 13 protein [Fibrobacter sp.]